MDRQGQILMPSLSSRGHKKSHAHLQCAHNICAKFQTDCLKTQGGVDYTNDFKGATDRRTDRQMDGQTDRGKT